MEQTAPTDQIKAHLMQTDEQFRSLAARHSEYDRILAALEAKPVLSAEEEFEEHRLKKLKLNVKDEMERYLVGSTAN